jgi:hypothetical protein
LTRPASTPGSDRAAPRRSSARRLGLHALTALALAFGLAASLPAAAVQGAAPLGPQRHPGTAPPVPPTAPPQGGPSTAGPAGRPTAPSSTGGGFGGVERPQAGLLGEYFDTQVPPKPGTPAQFVRVDPVIDFSWTGSAPPGTPLVPDNKYSERWTGYVRIDATGSWTFKTTSNDGVRLWVDGALIIDNWTQHPATVDTAAMTLAGDAWYPIQLEHFQDGGTAEIHLEFSGPGQPEVVIPSTHLMTGFTPPAVDAGGDQIVNLSPGAATLTGTASAQLGLRSVQWSQVSGPTATITGATTTTAGVTFGFPGTHVFRLTAFDARGVVASDDVTISVLSPGGGGQVSGTLRKWHPITIAFTDTVQRDERDTDNPFRNYRLQVYLLHPVTGTVHVVPGYFAADGQAADTGATSGDQWHAKFAPDHYGQWYYLASFRTGVDITAGLDPRAGMPTGFDGANGTFFVQASDPNAGGFLPHGMLHYVDGHHLRFEETGQYFLKGGADSPENLLGYYEFDGTSDQGGVTNDLNTLGYQDGLHHFAPHAGDYVSGTATTWAGGKGRNLYGAIEYLAGKGMNSIYFLTYNIDGGDGQEVWPWVDPWTKDRFDVSKLEQWGLVFEHMTRQGIALHVVTQEIENDQAIDGGTLGTERKMYYRELVARYGHNLAVTWNLGEENSNDDQDRKAFADHFRGLDTYDHPIVLHTWPLDFDAAYGAMLGFQNLEGPSMQLFPADVHWRTQQQIDSSSGAGKSWVVCNDEQNPATDGVVPDAVDYWHDTIRDQVLWGNLMAQGGGVEYYFGYNHADDDLGCEDWRSRDHMWDLTRYALEFFQGYLPFHRMTHQDDLTPDPNDYVLAQVGEVYAVYRPTGGSTTLDLQTSTNTFTVDWFDPRNGGALQPGSVAEVTGPGADSLGNPPPGSGDWVALVRRKDDRPPVIGSLTIEPDPSLVDGELSAQVRVTDPDGPNALARVELHYFRPDGSYAGRAATEHVGGELWSLFTTRSGLQQTGLWSLVVVAFDGAGNYDWTSGSFTVQ